ncbi:MAG: hypothetical protein HOD63_07595 [Bacteroidetes bacterium]|jgi:hypothetical protein|nr:hypothetical protein [Bacteroidota bacterium]MBT5989404.1 hypothetical protein [Bacteroidota bacterium]MBT6836478.1 hypothetical protein [Bacteroidota bacterium]
MSYVNLQSDNMRFLTMEELFGSGHQSETTNLFNQIDEINTKSNNLNPGRKPDKPISWVRPVLIAAGIITVGIILYKGYQYFQEEKQRKDIAKED